MKGYTTNCSLRLLFFRSFFVVFYSRRQALIMLARFRYCVTGREMLKLVPSDLHWFDK